MEHIPVRTCVGCRHARPQRDLVRLVVVDGVVTVDPQRVQPGRGAYVCFERDCLDAAMHRDAAALRRALRRPHRQIEFDGRRLAAEHASAVAGTGQTGARAPTRRGDRGPGPPTPPGEAEGDAEATARAVTTARPTP